MKGNRRIMTAADHEADQRAEQIRDRYQRRPRPAPTAGPSRVPAGHGFGSMRTVRVDVHVDGFGYRFEQPVIYVTCACGVELRSWQGQGYPSETVAMEAWRRHAETAPSWAPLACRCCELDRSRCPSHSDTPGLRIGLDVHAAACIDAEGRVTCVCGLDLCASPACDRDAKRTVRDEDTGKVYRVCQTHFGLHRLGTVVTA